MSGRTWAGRVPVELRTSCSPTGPSRISSGLVTALVEIEKGTDTPLPEGPYVAQTVTTDSFEACSGTGWTTLTQKPGRLVQRFNGDRSQGENPYGTYRVVLTRGGLHALARVSFGETYENDALAVRVADAMAARLARTS